MSVVIDHWLLMRAATGSSKLLCFDVIKRKITQRSINRSIQYYPPSSGGRLYSGVIHFFVKNIHQKTKKLSTNYVAELFFKHKALQQRFIFKKLLQYSC